MKKSNKKSFKFWLKNNWLTLIVSLLSSAAVVLCATYLTTL